MALRNLKILVISTMALPLLGHALPASSIAGVSHALKALSPSATQSAVYQVPAVGKPCNRSVAEGEVRSSMNDLRVDVRYLTEGECNLHVATAAENVKLSSQVAFSSDAVVASGTVVFSPKAGVSEDSGRYVFTNMHALLNRQNRLPVIDEKTGRVDPKLFEIYVPACGESYIVSNVCQGGSNFRTSKVEDFAFLYLNKPVCRSARPAELRPVLAEELVDPLDSYIGMEVNSGGVLGAEGEVCAKKKSKAGLVVFDEDAPIKSQASQRVLWMGKGRVLRPSLNEKNPFLFFGSDTRGGFSGAGIFKKTTDTEPPQLLGINFGQLEKSIGGNVGIRINENMVEKLKSCVEQVEQVKTVQK